MNTEAVVPASATVYARLRQTILHGELGMEPISQVELARTLGVSRTPLREALRMLQQERLIFSEPNRQVRVAPLSVDDLDQLYATRIVIEALCIRLTAVRITDKQLAELSQLLDEMDRLASERDADEWERPHAAFHHALRQHAGERLRQLARELSDHSERYRRVYLSEPRAWGSAALEHRTIVAACVARDAEAASHNLARHLARTALGAVAALAPEHDPVAVRVALQSQLAPRGGADV